MVAPDAAARATLMQQVAPLAITQTITYWATDAGQVYRAAATLVAADGSGQRQAVDAGHLALLELRRAGPGHHPT